LATVNIGNLTFTHKGDYASGTAYVKNDVVYYATNGIAYIAKQATQGNAPTSTAHWNVFVQKGTDGTDADLASISGTVQGDIYYNNGSAIARLAPGTSGQFLKTLGGSANPAWGTVSAAGLIETKIATSSTGYNVANSGGSWTHLSAWDVTYTPNSADNVLFIHTDVPTSCQYAGGSAGAALEMRVNHSGISQTRLYSHNTAQFNGGNIEIGNGGGLSFVWKPGTTNQLTFQMYGMDSQSNTTARFGTNLSGPGTYNGSKNFKFTLLEFSGSSGGTYNTGAY